MEVDASGGSVSWSPGVGTEDNSKQQFSCTPISFQSALASAFRYLTLTSARSIPGDRHPRHRRIGSPCWGRPAPQTSHTAMASDAMRLETTAGPASWWPDRKLSTPLSAAAKAATAREPQCGAGTAAPTRAMLRCRPMPLRPECDDLHRASAPAGVSRLPHPLSASRVPFAAAR